VRPHLLYPAADLDLTAPLPAGEPDLARDLGLEILLGTMAQGDQYLHDVARSAMHARLSDPEQIRYRQDVLSDCLRFPGTVREIYDLAAEALGPQQEIWGGVSGGPEYTVQRSRRDMEALLAALRKLRTIAERQSGLFSSAGFTALFAALRTELDDAYFNAVDDHLRVLRFSGGLLVSVQLDSSNKGTGYTLRRVAGGRGGLRGLLSAADGPAGYELVVPDRDVSGKQSISSLRDHALELVAGTLAGACDQVRLFFDALRCEAAFYLGCLHLHQELRRRGLELCLPVPMPARSRALAARGLCDPSLALSAPGSVVGNDVDADGKALVMITGANQGGKSTFLRSVGLAQLMMQSGMFVAAGSYSASACAGVFTHFRRSEDAAVARGKLDEELARMGAIADAICADGMLLCNESFASTNEREGSHIARTIVRGMLDCGVRVLVVTHFYDLANGFWLDDSDEALFLRADPRPDGTRTYRLTVGGPQLTSFAPDVYERVFARSQRDDQVGR
jgi:MutS domain V